MKVKIDHKPAFRSAAAGLIPETNLFYCKRGRTETNPSRRECSTVRVSDHRFGKFTAGRFGIIIWKWVIKPW
ncbi:MAG: hypothetical protein WCI20_10460 [bacterium]